MAKINYLIAAWHGPRIFDLRCPRPAQCTYYLRQQLRYLHALDHKLDQITIIVPAIETSPVPYWNYVRDLPAQLDDTKLSVFTRPNTGISYGGYIEACRHYKDDFSHFMLVEDDYVPVLDNFDAIFLEYVEKQGGGYVCSHIAPKSPDVASHSVGLVTTEAMIAAYPTHIGYLDPRHDIHPDRPHLWRHIQAAFARPIVAAGHPLGTIGNEFRVPYTDFNYWPKYWCPPENPDVGEAVFSPVQFASEFFDPASSD
jgi:hypothetical protein